MGKIEWSMWANEQALASSAVVVLGGIVTLAGKFKNYQFGIYGICVGVLVELLEYPRSKRQKGRTLERRISVPCCFILPTLLGGMCFLITSAIYFVAALKGEEWKAAGLDTESPSQQPGPRVLQPPSHPPPRQPIDNSI
ncbi:cytochrome b-245 light chain-like isoform X2 [Haliotis rubra]|uniref:cytochrome b-245 light chain-like isoform X2 n=1 Tax=Haliotis rubra TaxID=36100 RepID=UPI001EE52D71|nr:cytochrome b-245 light chain-like isoform X2 [Haliotis rubra]